MLDTPGRHINVYIYKSIHNLKVLFSLKDFLEEFYATGRILRVLMKKKVIRIVTKLVILRKLKIYI